MIDDLFQKATIAHSQNNLEEAQDLYFKILKNNSDNHQIHFLLGTLFLQKKLPKKALNHLKKAEPNDKDNPHLLMNLGLAYKEMGDYHLSEIYLKKSLSLNPHNADCLNNLGTLFLLNKNYVDAEQNFRSALQIKSNEAAFLINLSECLFLSGNKNESINLLLNIDSKSNYFKDAQKKLFDIFFKCNHFTEAIQVGENLIEVENASELESCISKLIICCLNNEDIKKAKIFLKKLNENSDAWIFCNANIDLECEQFEPAMKAYKQLLKNPKFKPNCHLNLGLAYFRRNIIDEAEKQFKLAIKYKPDNLEATKLLGLSQLSQCNFHDGWINYLSYTKNNIFTQKKFKKLKQWSGQTKNKKVLIFFDQGLGDQIFFSSLLIKLNTKNNFTCVIDPKLIKLFEHSFSDKIKFKSIETLQDIDSFDFFIRATELAPILIHCKADIPNTTGYLKTNPKAKIKPGTVGVSWHSKNNIIGRKKSLDLSSIVKKLKNKADFFINLQYGDHQEEIKGVMKKFNVKFLNIDENDNFNNIYELANIIQSCSEIYTISNTTAHLAGALGVSVKLLLPFNHQSNTWYWIKNENCDSLWYPNVKIIEAKKQQNFTTVLDLI